MFGKAPRGRIGERVIRSVDGKTIIEHRPKTKRNRPPTDREAANLALQSRIMEAYADLKDEDRRNWEAYARSLGKYVKVQGRSVRKVPRPLNLFKKAMGDRWRDDPNAPVMRVPTEPSLSVWPGDDI